MKTIFKKIRMYVAVIVLAGCTVSCDWLYTYPEGETLLDDFWKSESDVESMVASCYRSMLESDFMSRVIQWGEMRSDNVMGNGTKSTTEQLDFHEMNILPTTSLADWSTFYVTINYCNTVLYYAPGVCDIDKNFSKDRMLAYCAEVKAIRALCYFYLVRAFGAVPLKLEPTIDDSEGFNIAKTDGAVILDEMIKYLEEAKNDALTTFGSSGSMYKHSKGRFTKQSIMALLADIYLWQGYYQKCVDECNEFLDKYDATKIDPTQKTQTNTSSATTYQLVDAEFMLSTVFYSGNSSEGIFELQFTTGQVSNGAVTSLYGCSSDLGQLYVNYTELSQRFINIDDSRLKYFINTQSSLETEPQVTKYVCMSAMKSSLSSDYVFSLASSPSYTNWIFYRLPDIYLMKAEALVELNGEENFKEAIRCINVPYLRANAESDSLSYSSYQSQAQMRELVLNERQCEFMFEGKRWFDIVRQARKDGNTDYVMKYFSKYSSLGQNKLKDINALYMPISQSEMESNKLMEQNPFYQTDETSVAN